MFILSKIKQKKLIKILKEAKKYISDDANVLWTEYDSPIEIIDIINQHIILLANGDLSKINELELLFAPTGTLQELSISNEWGKEFIRLADQFDSYI